MEQRILAYHRYMEEQIEKLEHGDSVCDVERLKNILHRSDFFSMSG